MYLLVFCIFGIFVSVVSCSLSQICGGNGYCLCDSRRVSPGKEILWGIGPLGGYFLEGLNFVVSVEVSIL